MHRCSSDKGAEGWFGEQQRAEKNRCLEKTYFASPEWRAPSAIAVYRHPVCAPERRSYYQKTSSLLLGNRSNDGRQWKAFADYDFSPVSARPLFRALLLL